MRWLPLLLVLAGCGGSLAELPPPGAGGTVVINIWEPDGSPPTVLVAERIRQEGGRFERLHLDGVRARIVLPGLDCAVSAPSGSWTTANGQLALAGPVQLSGTWEGSPLLGTASAARLQREGKSVQFDALELWHRGQRLVAPTAELRQDKSLFAPKGIDSQPLPPELAAILSALPDPLKLPR